MHRFGSRDLLSFVTATLLRNYVQMRVPRTVRVLLGARFQKPDSSALLLVRRRPRDIVVVPALRKRTLDSAYLPRGDVDIIVFDFVLRTFGGNHVYGERSNELTSRGLGCFHRLLLLLEGSDHRLLLLAHYASFLHRGNVILVDATDSLHAARGGESGHDSVKSVCSLSIKWLRFIKFCHFWNFFWYLLDFFV